MGNEVYANMMEVSCKAAMGKSIAAFPDVCFTPPENPATPPGVPVPYPNTGMASDCTSGSTSVQISGQEVMLKDKSYFKQSYGDEAGCGAKKGVLTRVNRGKVFFNMWSMDVKVEGENVVRNLDLTTHNHASWVGNTPPQVYMDRMAMAAGLSDCDGMRKKVEEKCGDFDKPPCPDTKGVKDAEADLAKVRDRLKKKMSKNAMRSHPDYKAANKKVKGEYQKYSNQFSAKGKEGECRAALDCFLSPEKPSRCCKKQTPHHLIPSSCIVAEGQRNAKGAQPVLKSFKGYKSKSAPCICAEGPSWHIASHKTAHNKWADKISRAKNKTADLAYTNNSVAKGAPVITYRQALTAALDSAMALAPHCSRECFEAQLNQHHHKTTTPTKEQMDTPLRRTLDDPEYRSGSTGDVL